MDNKLDRIKHAAGKANPVVSEAFCNNPQLLKPGLPAHLKDFILKE